MPERSRVLFSERCRALAEECRIKAQSFHDDKQRDRMLQLAEDYVRKACVAADLEASLQGPVVEAPSLIPKIAETFVSRMKGETKVVRIPPKKSAKPRKRRTRRVSGETNS